MASPKRIAADPASESPSTAVCASYHPGGEVGRMQAELAERLAGARMSGIVADNGERLIRTVSMAGGYLLLLLTYGGVALLFWR